MPKIKAYAGNSSIIAVDSARVVTAFECPWTSKIFSTKKSYADHLKAVRETRIHRAIRARNRHKTFEELISQPSFEKIIEWIESHPGFFFDRAVQYRGRNNHQHLREKFGIKITYLNVNWLECVSNSHSCPRSGVTNWGGQERLKDGTSAPRGYAGWNGRIEFQLSHDVGFGSDVFRDVGVHTGTGGGSGDNRYGYDVKFFASDWPGLEKNSLVDILRNGVPAGALHGTPKYFRF